ncbi:MAG TPA: FAD-dependent oxidoreductase, partial [Chitinophagaceae bacterium]|nr:FAD-dependent oxidoreductase [Chitinophagaceae bacterium]
IPALIQERIFKFGITTLVPWRDGLWWVGSTYDNRFTDVLPTEHFRASMEAALRQILQLPFTVVDHIAAIRPATIERRPFVGLHPAIPHIGIFNGMGTKGCSLAPYFGEQLAQHLINGTPLLPQVDVQRFRKTLER